jgi:exodeoxyribonuclease V alpha subunit
MEAKRLSETTGLEAKTIHRLLEIEPASGKFIRNESNTLSCGLLVFDETSTVDVLLMHSLLRAVLNRAGVVLVGDLDQLPSSTSPHSSQSLCPAFGSAYTSAL